MACVKYMVEGLENKGWIGVELDYEEGRTPSIRGVIAGSSAEAVGLKIGDDLVALDGVAYATATEAELRQAKETMVPGRQVVLTIHRGGEEIEVPLTLGKMPASVLAQWVGTHVLEQHRHQFETAAVE